MAVGLGRARQLGIVGEDLAGVFDALEVLEPFVTGAAEPPALGRRVGVIGGGSTAMDAAAAAVRLGAEEVAVFYRRTEAEAPAHPHAIELARELGIRLRWLAAPDEIAGRDGRVIRVIFDTMRLGAPDRPAVPRPTACRAPGSPWTSNP